MVHTIGPTEENHYIGLSIRRVAVISVIWEASDWLKIVGVGYQ